MPAIFNPIVALHQVVPFDIHVLVQLSIEGGTAPELCPACARTLDAESTWSACDDAAEIDALVSRVEGAAIGGSW